MRYVSRRPATPFILIAVVSLGIVYLAAADPAPGTASVTVTDRVLLERPHRLGINIGKNTYYNDLEIVAEPFAHGGFAKGRQVLMLEVGESPSDVIIDKAFDASRPWRKYVDSFAGGQYCVATGPRAGEQGSIVRHDAGTGRFQLARSGPALDQGELVWLQGPLTSRANPYPKGGQTPLGIGDFRIETQGDVEVGFVDATADPRDQYLRITFPADKRDTSARILHHIPGTPDASYRLRLRARADGNGCKLAAVMYNLGVPGGQPGRTVAMHAREGDAIGTEWQDYVFDAQTVGDPRIADRFAAVAVDVLGGTGVGPANVDIDFIEFENNTIESESGFSRYLVEQVKEARCGVLRFWGIADLGSLVDDITARNANEASWTYVSYESGCIYYATCAVVDQWLRLSQEAVAAPWLCVGSANTPADWHNLISYLAAPAGFDAYADRRVAHGFEKPWSDAFRKIYLEIGNEWWNRIYAPFAAPNGQKYGELCATIIRAVRAHPHFDDDVFEIVCDGWAVNAHGWNNKLDTTCDGHDRISLAPYLVQRLDRVGTVEERYGSLFADVDDYAANAGRSCLDAVRTTGKGTGLCIYELNTHLTAKETPAAVASEICTSVGAGIAVLDQAMSCMSRMGTDPIAYFSYLQHSYGREGDARLGLWGNLIRTRGGPHRPRPVWLGLSMANRYLIEGDMVEVRLDNVPTWSQPQNGSVEAQDRVPYLHAYAFRTASRDGWPQSRLLLINRHCTDALNAAVTVPFTPHGPVRAAVLTSGGIADNNEEWEHVKLATGEVQQFTNGEVLPLPPFSATVLQIDGSGG